jgi:hypothetical protein
MRMRFIVAVIAAFSFVYLAGIWTPSAFAAENSSLKAEIFRSLNGTVLVSKVTLGYRAIATGYQTDWPVITIVNTQTGGVTYRVESGMVRFDVGQREMRRHFAQGSRFHVSGIDLKDDRLELMLDGGSGNSAKLRLVLGQRWQSNSDINAVMTQLARVFDLPNAPDSLSSTASATEGNTEQSTRYATKTVSQAGTSSNATQPEGASLSPELLGDSKALASVLAECKRRSGSMVGHEISDLQNRLGKEMTPRDAADISTMLRIADECTAYLSSPELVSGMELPAAQEARREAKNTLQRLNDISRTVAGNDLRSLEAQARKHLQSPSSSQSATASIQHQPPALAASANASVQPLVVYQRTSSAPELPGRISPEEVQAIITEASKEANRETNSFLSQAGSTVSADLVALYNATKRYPNFTRHPLMQSIIALQQQLGTSLQPKNVSDVETVTELLNRTLRIFGRNLGSESQLVYGHIEAETRAIDQYKAQQAAIVSAASTIANIERTLDQDRLMDADSQYQRMATDSFLSGFPPAHRYLADTAVLQGELTALREANQVPRVQGNQQLVEQVNVLANEVANAEAKSDKVLATVVFKKNMGEDRQSVQSRLASLSAFEFDPRMYRIQPITTETAARDAATRLRGLDGKLNSALDLIYLLASSDAMSKVRLLFGEALEAELRQKGKSIPLAHEMETSLTSAIQIYQIKRQQRLAAIQRQHDQEEARRQALIAERSNLAGTIWNEVLMITMLDEKFRLTEVMGYTMEAQKQRTELNSLLRRDSSMLTPSLWAEVDRAYQQMLPGLTVWRATHSRAIIEELRSSAR